MTHLRITWKKSYIGRNQSQRRVIHALGLRRLYQTVLHSDSPTIRGMVNKVSHMLEVEAVEGAIPERPPRGRRFSGSGERAVGPTERGGPQS